MVRSTVEMRHSQFLCKGFSKSLLISKEYHKFLRSGRVKTLHIWPAKRIFTLFARIIARSQRDRNDAIAPCGATTPAASGLRCIFIC